MTYLFPIFHATESDLMPRHSALLKLLDPSLDEDTARRAGALLEAVTDSLDRAGTTPLSETIPPPLFFDPEHHATVRPAPIDLAALAPGLPGNPDPGDWARMAPDVLASALAAGRLRPQDLYAELAGRIAAWQPVINAFLHVSDLSDAVPIGHGVLSGVPVGVQDMIDTAGVPTTAGSGFLRARVPDEDGAPWAALKAAGAVLAGKLNTQEFAAGTTGDNDWYGPMLNPWDPARTAGGAAGGAGAAVAAGLIPAAVGTDPGGSIRVPAAFCGVTCFKPTYGAVSRSGTIPLTWTTETVGVLASTVAGSAVLADLLLDGRSRERWGMGCAEAARRGRGAGQLALRVGIPANWIAMGLEPGIQARFEAALASLSALGAKLVEITLPEHDEIAPVHRAIAFSEASAIHESLIRAHAAEYGSLIRDRQEAGRGMLAIDYLNAWRLRGGFLRSASENWRQVDLIATPTAPVAAPLAGVTSICTGSRGPEAAHTVYTRYSAPMSTLGWPVVSVPVGLTGESLPAGLQLAGPPHSEPLVFLAAAALEEVIGWSGQPSLAAAQDRAKKEDFTDV